jgi:hypothetical protein
MTPGAIYFVKSENDLIKIGITNDLMARACELQRGSPVRINLDGYITVEIEKMQSIESDLHNKFDRHRRHGEWFDYVDEIKQYIKTNCNTECDFINDAISELFDTPREYHENRLCGGNLRNAVAVKNRRAEMESRAMKLLRVVQTAPGATSKEIAASFGCTKSLCISMLKLLESKNLIITEYRGNKIFYYPTESSDQLSKFRKSFENGVVCMKPTEREKISSPEPQYDIDPTRSLLLLYQA